jgi:hypothetical protein
MTTEWEICDTSKALHSEGQWHIMHRDYYGDRFFTLDYPYHSVIYHHCRNEWSQKGNHEMWTPPVHYRIDVEEMRIPCTNCKETCPTALVGLWTLHNFDIIQSSEHTTI